MLVTKSIVPSIIPSFSACISELSLRGGLSLRLVLKSIISLSERVIWAKLTLDVISRFLFLASLIKSTPFFVLTYGIWTLPLEYSKISISLKILIDSDIGGTPFNPSWVLTIPSLITPFSDRNSSWENEIILPPKVLVYSNAILRSDESLIDCL